MKFFFKSFRYAARGISILLKGRNFKVQLFILLCTILAGLYFSISLIEWIAILIISGLVLSAEGFNTAIEHLCDLYSTDSNSKIADIKDVSAGAVLILSIFALVIGILIFGKYFFDFSAQSSILTLGLRNFAEI